MKKIVSLLAAITIIFHVNAQYTFEPGEQPGSIDLAPYATYADAGQKDLSIDEVKNNGGSLIFRPLSNRTNIGFTNHHYWANVILVNNSGSPATYYLETGRPVTDHADLYTIASDGKVTAQHSGDDMAFSERSFSHRKSLFKVQLDAGQKVDAFVHLKSDGEVINLPLVLHTPDELLSATYIEQLVYGIFYGIMLIAAITYLFFYFALKERIFLHYGLYVIFVALMQFSLDGFFYQYLQPLSGWFNLRAVLVFSLVTAFFLGKYISGFLDLEEHFPKATYVFRTLYALTAVLLASILFVPQALAFCYPAANILGLVVLATVLVSLAVIYARKVPVDGFFSAGIFFMVLGFIVFILHNFRLVSNSFLTENSSKIGTGFEVIFLSLSMSNRIRILKRDKEQMHTLALKRSEEMSELKSFFMSNMSHELRTPLNAIMGMAEIMGKEVKDEKLKTNLDLIRYASIGLLSSVNDILDFSQIERGELKLEEETFEPLKVLDQIRLNAENQAKDKKLCFQYINNYQVPLYCKGDAMRFGQIVNNVLSNAIKFTKEGTVRFTVEGKQEKDGQVKLSLTITDTGTGIPKDKIDSVFESFTQESINNKRKFGGLGLGLCIVKHLVDLHGGTINISSTVGLGTICSIDLTYVMVERAMQQASAFPENEFNLLHSRILIVEDNRDNQIILKALFDQWDNTRCAIASNGMEALEMMRKDEYDIVLMDLQMPVMDGYETTELIRQGEAGEHHIDIPIMAVTADTMPETRNKVKEVGMDDYLSKPIDQRMLYNKITYLLSHPVKHQTGTMALAQ